MPTLVQFDSKISDDEIIKQKIERFSQVFTRVNSTLTLRPVKVRTEHSLREAPAWSTADTVTFNSRLIGDLKSPTDIAMLRGLDLHEVAHILYTPRTGSEIWQWVENNNVFDIFNLLEDQRIETMLVGRYPSIIPWISATIAKFLIDTEHFDNSYPLLRGRRYLPSEIRKASREAYKHQDKVSELCRIIDEYRTIVFPRDTERAKTLIEDMAALLRDTSDSPLDKIFIASPFGHGDRPSEGQPSSTSRPASEREQEQDQKRSDNVAGEDDSEDDGDDESSSSTPDTSKTESDSTDPSTGQEEASGSGGQQAGTSGEQTFEDMLQALVDEVLEENAAAIEDIARQIAGLPSLASNNTPVPQKSRIRSTAVEPHTLHAARTFGRELERIRTANDPSWLRGVDEGRLDAYRAARGDDPDTVYDIFKRGREDATDIECVIALDVSGSMSGQTGQDAYQAMYAIKRALDRIDASTTVLTFGSNTHMLYRADEKADVTVRDGGIGGGTDPVHAVNYATKILAETNRAVRLFIAITDGDWFNAEQADESIRKMRRAGVLTSLAYISRYGDPSNDHHNCESFTVIRKVPDIVNVAREIVRVGIARRLLNA